MQKIRLDILLVERHLVESRTGAQRLIMAGEVVVNGDIAMLPSQKVDKSSTLEILQTQPYISRGGEKLKAALSAFGREDLTGKICADVGASTGGFTDCLLKHGAIKVYAIDVGYGLLHWSLRNHPKVVVMEKTNARYLETLPEKINLVTIDASFISLDRLLPVVKKWFGKQGEVIALIKPQFEVSRKEASKGRGVIWDKELHEKVVSGIIETSIRLGYLFKGTVSSPLLGPKGNREFFIHLAFPKN